MDLLLPELWEHHILPHVYRDCAVRGRVVLRRTCTFFRAVTPPVPGVKCIGRNVDDRSDPTYLFDDTFYAAYIAEAENVGARCAWLRWPLKLVLFWESSSCHSALMTVLANRRFEIYEHLVATLPVARAVVVDLIVAAAGTDVETFDHLLSCHGWSGRELNRIIERVLRKTLVASRDDVFSRCVELCPEAVGRCIERSGTMQWQLLNMLRLPSMSLTVDLRLDMVRTNLQLVDVLLANPVVCNELGRFQEDLRSHRVLAQNFLLTHGSD